MRERQGLEPGSGARTAGVAGVSPAGPRLSPSRSLLLPRAAGMAASLPSLGMLLLLLLRDPNSRE